MPDRFIIATACVGFIMTVASAEQITLVNGDRIVAPLIEETASAVVVDHPVFGELRIPRGQIVAIVKDIASDDATVVTVDADDIVVEDGPSKLPELPPSPKEVAADQQRKKLWESRFEMAFSDVEGNTNTQDLSVAFRTKRETEQSIFKADAAYFVAASDGDRTDNAATAGAEHEWLIPDSKWSYFVYGRWDFDEFQSWDYRITAGGGVKYHLVEKENYDLKLRGGLGLIKEFGSENDDIRPEALFGFEGEWRIAEKQKLTYHSTIYPDLSDLGEFRTVSGIDWVHVINDSLDFFLGLHHEYQSQVDPGFEKNDLRIYGGLGLNF